MVGDKPGYVDTTCHDRDSFRGWSSAGFAKALQSLEVAADRSHAGALSMAKFRELQQVVGFNLNRHGMVFDAELRSHCDFIGAARYDWVHSMLADGVFTIEVGAFMKAHEGHGATRDLLRAFFSYDGWRFPTFSRLKARQLWRVFDDYRTSAAEPEKLKCTCAEMLGVAGLLRHYIETRVPVVAELQPQRASFDAAARVLDLLTAAKHQTANVQEAAVALGRAASEHLKLHKAAYGTELLRPKHHWVLDVADQIRADGCVIDSFVIERRHLLVKMVAEHIDNLRTFERSVMSSMCVVALQDAQSAVFGDGLIGTATALAGSQILVSNAMTIFNFEVHGGDVVARGEELGLIGACCLEQGRLCVAVEPLDLVAKVSAHSGQYRLCMRTEVWPAAELSLVVAWYDMPSGDIVVVHR